MLRRSSGCGSFVPRAMAALLGTLAACGTDDEPARPGLDGGGRSPSELDAQTGSRDAALDARGADELVEDLLGCAGNLPVMTVPDLARNSEIEPDWSCYEAVSPDAGVARDAGSDAATVRNVLFRLEPLSTSLLGGLTIDFFFGPSTLGAAALTRVIESDASTVSFAAPASARELSARLHALTRAKPEQSVVEMREYGFTLPAEDARIDGYAMIGSYRSISVDIALTDAEEDPQKAVIVASARDCRGRNLSGAQFELIDGETNVPFVLDRAPGKPRAAYFQFALPNPACTYTTADSPAWMMANVPTNIVGDRKTHSYRLRLKGRMRASDLQPVTIGERELELFPGVISLVRLHR